MAKRLFCLVAVLAATSLAGCFESDDGGDNNNGGNGGGGDCSFTPCGGDVVGTWNSYGFCAASDNGLDMYPGCDDAVVSGDPDFTGSTTFGADGSFTQDTTIDGDVHYEYDDDCIASMSAGLMDGPTYCAFVQAMTTEVPGFSGTCAYAGGKCTCDLSIQTTDTQTGTYTAANNALVIDGGTPVPYCVSGTELRVFQGSGAIAIFRK